MESEEERIKKSVRHLLNLISGQQGRNKDARPYLSELEGFKLTKEEYRFGLAELITTQEYEDPEPGTNWHKAKFEDLFDDEPGMSKIREEAEKEAENMEQQETEVKQREFSEAEKVEAQDIRYHVNKYLNVVVAACKVLPTKQAIGDMTLNWSN